MQYRDCVYKDLLPYLLVLSKRDGFNFARKLIDLFPFYRIDGPANTLIAGALLDKIDAGEDLKGETVSKAAFARVVVNGHFMDLNRLFKDEAFEDFLFDIDTRHRVDALSMSHSFRKRDILNIFRNKIPEDTLSCYLKHFSDFSSVTERSIWIDRYVFDDVFHSLFQQSVSNSRQYILTMLELAYSGPERSPAAEMDKVLTIIEAKLVEAMRSHKNNDLEKWLKLKMAALDKYNAMLGGDTDVNTQKLMDALGGDAAYRDPQIYTVEELNKFGDGK
jgi:hypothetical protein